MDEAKRSIEIDYEFAEMNENGHLGSFLKFLILVGCSFLLLVAMIVAVFVAVLSITGFWMAVMMAVAVLAAILLWVKQSRVRARGEESDG